MKRYILSFILSFMVIGSIWSNAISVEAKLSKGSCLSSLNNIDIIELGDFSEFELKIDNIFLASQNNNSSIEFRRAYENEPIFSIFGEQYLYTVPTNFSNHDFEFELELNYQYSNIDEVGTLQIEFLCAYSDELLSYDELSTIAYIKFEGDYFTNETSFEIVRGVDDVGGAIAIGSGILVDLDTLPKTDILFKGSRNSSGINLQVINNQTSETIIAETVQGFNSSVSHICIEYLTNYQNGNFNASVCNFNSIIYGSYLPTETFSEPLPTMDLGGKIYFICSVQIVLTLMILISRKKKLYSQ